MICTPDYLIVKPDTPLDITAQTTLICLIFVAKALHFLLRGKML